MKPTDISIIMPCYNAGAYVKTAIESVLQQDIRVQLIVVDDGSTDNTHEILSAFSGDILALKANHEGVANARNKAIEHLNSRYTLLLDADDALAPGSLACLHGRIRRTQNEVVYGNFSSWDSTLQRRLNLHRPVRLGKAPLSFLARQNISPPGAVLFPTEAFARIGNFDQAVASCEDWDFLIRMARAGYRFTGLNREVFYYRRLPTSASNQVRRMLDSGLEVIRRCHNPDLRVRDDLYAEGFRADDLVHNLLGYHASCLGLASLSTNDENFVHILKSIQVPAHVNWKEFGKKFRVSLRWNSLARDGEQEVIIRQAYKNVLHSIRLHAADQPWCRDMIFGMLSPDFTELLLRPGPKKALRLLREWKAARTIADDLSIETIQ